MQIFAYASMPSFAETKATSLRFKEKQRGATVTDNFKIRAQVSTTSDETAEQYQSSANLLRLFREAASNSVGGTNCP